MAITEDKADLPETQDRLHSRHDHFVPSTDHDQRAEAAGEGTIIRVESEATEDREYPASHQTAR
jgi:hypothetical protein